MRYIRRRVREEYCDRRMMRGLKWLVCALCWLVCRGFTGSGSCTRNCWFEHCAGLYAGGLLGQVHPLASAYEIGPWKHDSFMRFSKTPSLSSSLANFSIFLTCIIMVVLTWSTACVISNHAHRRSSKKELDGDFLLEHSTLSGLYDIFPHTCISAKLRDVDWY